MVCHVALQLHGVVVVVEELLDVVGGVGDCVVVVELLSLAEPLALP